MSDRAAIVSTGRSLEGMVPSDGGERQGDCQNGGARNRELHVEGAMRVYAAAFSFEEFIPDGAACADAASSTCIIRNVMYGTINDAAKK